MTYAYGATRQNPETRLAELNKDIDNAAEVLDRYTNMITTARTRLHALKQQPEIDRATFHAEYQEAYDWAMLTHPDNVTKGPLRLAQLGRERAAAERKTHQEAA